MTELDVAKASIQSLQRQLEGAREALRAYHRLHKSVAADLLSAHQGRGNGTTQWMTEDDSDLRKDFRAAGDLAASTLGRVENIDNSSVSQIASALHGAPSGSELSAASDPSTGGGA